MNFPKLKTSALAQYPLRRSVSFGTRVLRFLDGSEQRFAQRPQRHEWTVDLSQLDEDEMAAFVDFFRQAEENNGVFSFTDPTDGTVYPACRFAKDTLTVMGAGIWSGRMRVAIEEDLETA